MNSKASGSRRNALRLTSIRVAKLFDTFDYAFRLNEAEHVTLLYGPNGYGKTTILRLIEALSKGSLSLLRITPFQSLTLKFDDSSELNVLKSAAAEPNTLAQCSHSDVEQFAHHQRGVHFGNRGYLKP
jgi:predicted ATP-binding protein involved in virulence